MSVTVLPNSKWQPSVLQLLPFSPNAAGTSSTSSVPQHNSGPHTASYIQEEARGFPALAISQKDRDKLRSKSAGVPDKSSLRRQQHSLRPQTIIAKEQTQTPTARAKSDYGVNSVRKAENVKFSINDINEQILGRNSSYGDKNSESSDASNYRSDGGETKIKPLPKPAMRSREGRWPNARFWRSSSISPGELELQKHKTHLDIQTSRTRKSKRVKLNVKDLPRSKTPIGENDPDKLNMKHVIAFLQNNANQREDKEDTDECEAKVSAGNDFKPNSELAGRSGTDQNSNVGVDATTQGVTSHEPIERTRQPTKANVETLNAAPKESDVMSAQFQSNSTISASEVAQQSNPSERQTSTQIDRLRSLVHLDKHIETNYDGMRPKSLSQLHERTEFRLPANLRHIRESANDLKPFRLHRFLTLVSNTSVSANISVMPKALKHTNLLSDNTASRYRSQSSLSRSLIRSSKGSGIESRHEGRIQGEPRRSNSEARRYYVSGDVSRNDRYRRRAKSQESFYHKDSLPQMGNKNKIICLPVAPVDVDSDDDYNPLPSVPGRLDRQHLTLSAQGRAIIAKHFPASAKVGKNGTRPHSVKDIIQWAEQKSEELATSKQRPHSMQNIKLDHSSMHDKEDGLLLNMEGVKPETSPPTTDCGQNMSCEAVAGDISSAGDERTLDSTRQADTEKQQASPSSPSRSEMKSHRSKSSSSNKSKASNGIITFPTEVRDLEDDAGNEQSSTSLGIDPSSMTLNSSGNINASIRHGARGKRETPSPSLHTGDPVKLTLRRERNLTRELTYMVDMELSSARSRATGNGSNR